MNTKKEKLYGSVVNLSGLYSDKPILLQHNKDFVRDNKYAREKVTKSDE